MESLTGLGKLNVALMENACRQAWDFAGTFQGCVGTSKCSGVVCGSLLKKTQSAEERLV
jgi:hypothetical protein